MHDFCSLVLGLGIFIEGVRLIQLPFVSAYFMTQIVYGGDRLDNLFLIEAGLALSIFLFALYGEPGYNRVRTTGPYAVGFREFTTKELWNDCSVFYPIDIDQMGEADSVTVLRYAKSLSGFASALSWQDGSQKGLCDLRAKFMTFVSVQVAENAPLARDFSHGSKKMQPLVFSHGDSYDRMFYSGILRELASYGFLVIALNHNDGSCLYTMGDPLATEDNTNDL